MPPFKRLARLPFASLRRKILAAFASATLVLIVGLVSFTSVMSLRRTVHLVEHTYQVLAAADGLLAALSDAETGQRGFLLTGSDRYLDAYRSGVPAVDTTLQALRRLTADNPVEQRRVDSLTVLSRAKLSELAQTITLRRQGLAPALAVVKTGEGRSLMREVRSIAERMKSAERTLLVEREASRDRNAIATLIVIAVGSVVAFVLAAGITNTIRVDVERREHDRLQIEAQTGQLQDQAAELESQQAELEAQTDELRASNDELVAANARVERALVVGRRAHARLKRSYGELDQFAYVASHDLKAPLRGIANLAAWLEEDLGPAVTDSAREQMTLLQGRVHRMEALIDGILQYSRAGRVATAPEQVDVGALVRDVVQLLALPTAVTVDIAPGMPVLVTERVPLEQVFLNLINNAAKYGRRPDVRIEVGVQQADGVYEFSVTDNGPGIAQEYHERIFGIFQTLDARDKVEGTGIGLSVVKKIIEARGGRVTLESAEGAGATFRFTWPDQPPEET